MCSSWHGPWPYYGLNPLHLSQEMARHTLKHSMGQGCFQRGHSHFTLCESLWLWPVSSCSSTWEDLVTMWFSIWKLDDLEPRLKGSGNIHGGCCRLAICNILVHALITDGTVNLWATSCSSAGVGNMQIPVSYRAWYLPPLSREILSLSARLWMCREQEKGNRVLHINLRYHLPLS